MGLAYNVPVLGSMLQEEARGDINRKKIKDSDFVASNGWLEKFKQKYSICNKTVAEEAGDVREETMKSWNKHAREITSGWNARDVWNMDETGCFWCGLPDKKKQMPREDGALEGKKRSDDYHGHFLQMGKGRRNILLLARPSVRDALRIYSRQAGHTTALILPTVKLG